MPRLAANLSMMYHEHAFLDRFAAAARDGFAGVEFLFPYEHAAVDIKSRLDDAALTQALFNAPPGDWAKGERGIASVPGRDDEFRRSIDTALDYARVLGNRKIHVMAGLVANEAAREAQRAQYVEQLAYAARTAAADGITVLIEPINPRDIPGYLLNRQDDAQAICAQVGAPNLQVQFDCYHCQIVEGDVTTKLKRDIARVGHIQVAGVPERHEPDRGELNTAWLLDVIDELGYEGWVGCEYRPRAGTSAGLDWARKWLAPRA
ncbi:2-oxo-tetronate isomerase [Paraburkholderia acidisoli]|uniref:TIM barrel protein n=1 Tax=Paraburkholderia acidisoli TaxID=2571748 RepID=A0A7Z2GLF8_9BURK|nr:2-oxo-tetronate isomerase [Paraburkholderia acidisoli]QGZ63978.1 TIM barrel protein [Paraburkholderia acidisoli]